MQIHSCWSTLTDGSIVSNTIVLSVLQVHLKNYSMHLLKSIAPKKSTDSIWAQRSKSFTFIDIFHKVCTYIFICLTHTILMHWHNLKHIIVNSTTKWSSFKWLQTSFCWFCGEHFLLSIKMSTIQKLYTLYKKSVNWM